MKFYLQNRSPPTQVHGWVGSSGRDIGEATANVSPSAAVAEPAPRAAAAASPPLPDPASPRRRAADALPATGHPQPAGENVSRTSVEHFDRETCVVQAHSGSPDKLHVGFLFSNLFPDTTFLSIDETSACSQNKFTARQKQSTGNKHHVFVC